MRQTTLYAHKEESGSEPGWFWTDFYPQPAMTRLCDPSLPVLKVQVTEDENGDHWGWWDNQDQQFAFIDRHKNLVEICFPYAIKGHIERGEGLLLKVRVDELELWKPQKS